jgi:enterochelin esterase-like enzyme
MKHTTPSTTRRQFMGAAAALGSLSILPACDGSTPLPTAASGRIERWADWPSRHVVPRQIDIWLPPDFKPDGSHAVLYMHDGQMLFDNASTWNGKSWNLPATAGPLIAAGQIRPFIVVGVWNTGVTRFAEYFPEGILDRLPAGPDRERLLSEGLGGKRLADAYLRCLVEELRPAIEIRYGTATGPANTMIAGSSMGGLISLGALCEYPAVFGGAACLSTHWIGGFQRNAVVPAAALAYLKAKLPPPGRHRLYMDRGTADLDGEYDEAQAAVDALLRERSYGPPLFTTRVFEGEGHNETAWGARLALPLRHLFG